MLKKMIWCCCAVVAFASSGLAVDMGLIEKGLDDLSYARSEIRRLLEENSRHHNSSLRNRLSTIDDLLSESHQNITLGLYGDRPAEPITSDYKFVCKSSYAPGAIGKGWTRLEARAGAALLCTKEKNAAYCDDDAEFTCESVPEAFPRRGLEYSRVCSSNYVPGALGFGWTVIEARAAAATLCTKEKNAAYCDDAAEFTCEAVNPEFLRHSRRPYRFACLSNYAPGALGKGLTKTEAIAEAGKACRSVKNAAYCDDDAEFTCEAIAAE